MFNLGSRTKADTQHMILRLYPSKLNTHGLVHPCVQAIRATDGRTQEPARTIEAALRRRRLHFARRQSADDSLVHELTAIPARIDFRKFDREFALTNRLRTEGTDNLLTAAYAAGVRRFIAQSYAGWPYARQGGPVKTEEDPLDPNPPSGVHKTLEAIRYLESAVLGSRKIQGVVLRYAARLSARVRPGTSPASLPGS